MKDWLRGAPGLLLTVATAVAAAAQAAVPDTRAALEAERARVEAAYHDEMAACARRFVVTPCQHDARVKRRDTLVKLNRRIAALDAAQRRERARLRQQEVERKLIAEPGAASAREPRAAASAAPAAAQVHRPEPRADAGEEGVARRAAAKVREKEKAAQAAAQRSHSAAERQQQAEERRRRVEARNAGRNARQPRAAPLPAPPASTPSPAR
jgi:hypothetical protein